MTFYIFLLSTYMIASDWLLIKPLIYVLKFTFSTQETFHQDFLESECFSVSKNMEKCYLYIWESFWESFSRMNHNMLIIVATTRIERVDMSYRVCSIYFTTLSCYHEQYVMSSEYIINIYDLARIYFFRKDNYYENAHTFICSWPTYHQQ